MRGIDPIRKYDENSDIDHLVKKCQSGDFTAYEGLYEIFKDKMFNIAYRMLGDADDAADSLQESFIKIYKNISNFKFESSFYTWSYRILMNTCLDSLRRRKSLKKSDLEVYENVLSVEDKLNFENELIEKEIFKLPPAYKTVFILYEIEGFSHQEISGILQISAGTSKSNLHRAKAILKEKLRSNFENSDG